MLNLEVWQLWLIGGVILIILEMFTFTFILASFGLAAMITAIPAANGASTNWQLTIFAISNVVLLTLLRPLAKKGLYRNSEQRPTNANAIIGQTATVLEEIADQHRPGRVKLGSEEWLALSSAAPVPPNTIVEVVGIDGATLVVRPIIN